MSPKLKSLFINFVISLFWVMLWWGFAWRINSFYLPSPLDTAKVLWQLLLEPDTYIIIGMTLWRVILALFIAIMAGLVTGIMAGLSKTAFQFFQPVMVAIKSTPVISFIIIAMIYFKSPHVPVFCGVLVCLPIIYYNVVEGIHVIDPQLLNMSKLYRVPLRRVVKRIYFPGMIPYINAGILTSIGVCWKGTIAAEVISVVQKSIGYKIYNAKVYLETPEVFAWTFIIILCSIIIESLTKKILLKNKYYKGLKVV